MKWTVQTMRDLPWMVQSQDQMSLLRDCVLAAYFWGSTDLETDTVESIADLDE